MKEYSSNYPNTWKKFKEYFIELVDRCPDEESSFYSLYPGMLKFFSVKYNICVFNYKLSKYSYHIEINKKSYRIPNKKFFDESHDCSVASIHELFRIIEEDKMSTFKINWDDQKAQKIRKYIDDYIAKHQCTCGEDVAQRDAPQVDAINLASKIVDALEIEVDEEETE